MRLLDWHSIQSRVQDGLDTPVGEGLTRQRPGAGRLETFATIPALQANQTQAGPIALFRVRLAGQDSGNQLPCRITDFPTPVNDPGRSPFGVCSMGGGHMLALSAVTAFPRKASVAGHPFSLTEHLDRMGRQSNIQRSRTPTS